jgi:hypothetical protein
MWKLSENEAAKLEAWLKTKDHTKYAGCSGGRFTYCFTPTTLGIVYKVIDNLDKNEIDITDYKDW